MNKFSLLGATSVNHVATSCFPLFTSGWNVGSSGIDNIQIFVLMGVASKVRGGMEVENWK